MIDLRHLRYYVVVAEELHFHRAAERLHVAQPSLSQTIKRLEQDLGVVLLRRSTRSVELTPAGAAFLEKARATLANFDEAIAIAREFGDGKQGQIVVGGSAQLPQCVSHLLHQFHREHPNVEVSKREDGTSRLLAGVVEHEIDVAVGLTPARLDGLSYRAIGRDRLLLVVRDGHRLAKRASVSWSDLVDETLVVSSDRSIRGFEQFLVERCRAAGFEPNLLHRPTEHEELFQSVLDGHGVELRCSDFVSMRQSRGIQAVPMVPEEAFLVEVFWRSDESNPAARRFVEVATGQSFRSER